MIGKLKLLFGLIQLIGSMGDLNRTIHGQCGKKYALEVHFPGGGGGGGEEGVVE